MSMNLLKPISVEGNSKKVKIDMGIILCRKKATSKTKQNNNKTHVLELPNWSWKGKEKSSETGYWGVDECCKKMYEDGDDRKQTINKACVEPREKQAKGDAEFWDNTTEPSLK